MAPRLFTLQKPIRLPDAVQGATATQIMPIRVKSIVTVCLALSLLWRVPTPVTEPASSVTKEPSPQYMMPRAVPYVQVWRGSLEGLVHERVVDTMLEDKSDAHVSTQLVAMESKKDRRFACPVK